MPRLIVPSIGGGTKLMRTVRVAAGVGVGSGVNDSLGEGAGVGDSCASPTADAQTKKIAATVFVI